MARNTSNILQQVIRAISGLSSKQNATLHWQYSTGRRLAGHDAQGYLLLQQLQAAVQVRRSDLTKYK